MSEQDQTTINAKIGVAIFCLVAASVICLFYIYFIGREIAETKAKTQILEQRIERLEKK